MLVSDRELGHLVTARCKHVKLSHHILCYLQTREQSSKKDEGPLAQSHLYLSLIQVRERSLFLFDSLLSFLSHVIWNVWKLLMPYK